MREALPIKQQTLQMAESALYLACLPTQSDLQFRWTGYGAYHMGSLALGSCSVLDARR